MQRYGDCKMESSNTMTARTLEEIAREIAKLGSQKWYGSAHTLRLLTIAQEQRAALLAIWPFVEEDDGGFATPQYQAAINQVRATLGVGTKR